MEEIQAPDIQRAQSTQGRPPKGATMPPPWEELRAPDEGSPSSHGAEARGGCSDVPVGSAGSQLCQRGPSPRPTGQRPEGAPPPRRPTPPPSPSAQMVNRERGVSSWREETTCKDVTASPLVGDPSSWANALEVPRTRAESPCNHPPTHNPGDTITRTQAPKAQPEPQPGGGAPPDPQAPMPVPDPPRGSQATRPVTNVC
ncbi:proline-rich protein 2-like [Pelmatolapia mariae]|uniref:proline-rich protein 2-like n=1 Tax=Pelmatolapia mariae TaxID=158779 RepID=UPI003211D430